MRVVIYFSKHPAITVLAILIGQEAIKKQIAVYFMSFLAIHVTNAGRVDIQFLGGSVYVQGIGLLPRIPCLPSQYLAKARQ